MKHTHQPQSATSLPRAPRDETASRFTRYLIMMGIRVLCFILATVVQPYGWWTWAFAAGAVFIPYIAVVFANVGMDARAPRAVSPERMLPAAPTHTTVAAPPTNSTAPVIQISETPRTDDNSSKPGTAS